MKSVLIASASLTASNQEFYENPSLPTLDPSKDQKHFIMSCRFMQILYIMNTNLRALPLFRCKISKSQEVLLIYEPLVLKPLENEISPGMYTKKLR